MQTTVQIANYDWIVVRDMGTKYLLISQHPLFVGYYSRTPCLTFPESNLYRFLNERFIEHLSGVPLTNLSVPTTGQYEMYLKDREPLPTVKYVLQTNYNGDKERISVVETTGEIGSVDIGDKISVRPMFFVDKSYIESLNPGTPITPLVQSLDDLISAVSPPAPKEILDENNDTSQEANQDPLEGFKKATREPEIDPLQTPLSPPDSTDAEILDDNELPSETCDLQIKKQEPVQSIPEPFLAENISREENNVGIYPEPFVPKREITGADEDIGEDSVLLYPHDTKPRPDRFVEVWAYKGEYKDYAILIDINDPRSQDILSKCGKVIREFQDVSINEKRNADVDAIRERMDAMQSKWSWKKQEKEKKT